MTTATRRTTDPLDLDAFDAVLLDLDGTLRHVGGADLLAGAAELVARLARRRERTGRPFAVLSNSTLSPSRVAAALRPMLAASGASGAAIGADLIYTAAAAACDHVVERFGGGGRTPRVFDLMGDATVELLADAGRAELIDADDGGPCDAIVVGTPSGPWATVERQRAAVRFARAGAAVVGSCADRVYPSPRGLEIGAGALTALVAYAADVEPTFCGKPEAVFFAALCRRLGVAPSRCVLVGDNLESDVAGGRGVGMATVLVLGGVSTRADAGRAPLAARPDAIIPSLEALVGPERTILQIRSD